MSDIISPITGYSNCSYFDRLASEEIVSLYAEQHLMDVSRFFQGITDVKIFTCEETGYRFYHPRKLMGDGLFYEELQKIGESSNNEYYRVNTFDHQFAKKYIEHSDKVLEIGCGMGNFMQRLKAQNIEVVGLELNKYAVEKCRLLGLEVYDTLIDKFAENNSEQFDVVCTFQVLEHVYDVKGFISSALRTLKKDGLLIISVPNSDPFLMRHDKYATLNLPPHHVGLWNKKVFENLTTIFPIELLSSDYSSQVTIKGDVYYRLKNWIGSKSLIEEHSFAEKVAMGFFTPLAIPLSIKDKLLDKLHGNQICVVFRKKV